jgi:polyhydroxybutyrate depolymerase
VAGAVPMWQTGLHSADMAFIGALLDRVEATLCVDRARVYVTGLSDGAFMTSAVACVYAGRVAAVAPVAGIQVPAGCHPSRPVPVVAFHGTADPFVPYDGGLGPAALALPAPDGSHRTLGQVLGPHAAQRTGPSGPAVTARWARRNGCAAAPTTRSAPGVARIAYRCPSGADVVLYRISGGGHAWPGSALSRSVASVVGFTTMAVSADEVIWRFFAAHPLRR